MLWNLIFGWRECFYGPDPFTTLAVWIYGWSYPEVDICHFWKKVNPNWNREGYGEWDFQFFVTFFISLVVPPNFAIVVKLISGFARELIYLWNDKVVRFDKAHWTNKVSNPNGLDCNGNTGPGLYCHCPSQGYLCGCKRESYDGKTECYDHQGYTC